MLSNVGTKRRKYWLLAASALASSSLGLSEPALAQICTPAQPSPDPARQRYLHGQLYQQHRLRPAPPAPATQLHVTLNPDRQCHPPRPGNRRSAKQLRQQRTRSSVSKWRNN